MCHTYIESDTALSDVDDEEIAKKLIFVGPPKWVEPHVATLHRVNYRTL